MAVVANFLSRLTSLSISLTQSLGWAELQILWTSSRLDCRERAENGRKQSPTRRSLSFLHLSINLKTGRFNSLSHPAKSSSRVCSPFLAFVL